MSRDLSYTICPKCRFGCLEPVGESKGGFSLGKATAGAIIAGPIGLAAGALGKKQKTYRCDHCGYMVTE